MKKSKFIRSSIILIIGGFLTKMLGMLCKIILTRTVGIEIMGLYSMLMPTFLLLISISGMGLSTALNVLISSRGYNNKNLIIYALIISLSLDILILFILIFNAKFITTTLLNNEILYYPLISIGFVLPFISISNIFRSYYFSKERMIPHVISNVLEDLIKLLLIYFFAKFYIESKEKIITFIIMTNILCELSSIIIFLIKFPKFIITKSDIKPNKNNLKAIFKISLPTLASKLIGSFTYFLEPIIITTILTKLNYSNDYIIREYGIINAYVMPIILLPSFFTNAISQSLIPIVSENYYKRNVVEIKRKIKQALFISLTIGIAFLTFLSFKSDLLLKFLYNTTEGIKYIRFILPIFIFHYLEQPLLSCLQAMNKSHINLKISLVNMFIRTILLAGFLYLNIGIYGLLISLMINILFTFTYSFYKVNNILANT